MCQLIYYFNSYTLKLYILWVSSFYRICFWKASGSREPLAPTIFTFLPKPLLWQRWGLYSLVFIYSCKNYDCFRGVAESSAWCMMCLPSCCATFGLVLLLFLWASSQSPIIQSHSYGVGNHLHPSCSAQTLRRVSSLKRCFAVVFIRICFWKASGSRETPARFCLFT